MNNNLVISKHNHLIEASYHLSLEEQRLVLSCIAKIDPREGVVFPEEIFITAKEFSGNFGFPLNGSYTHLKRAGENLYNQTIKISNEKNKKSMRKLRWIYSYQYLDGEAKIGLKFSPEIKPYLGQLSGVFTSYKLKNISRITSTHAIRLYELLIQWRSSGHRYINIDDFKNMLILGEKYPRYSDLRRWVIEPAVKEINKKTDLTVGFSVDRNGRKVSVLKFKIKLTKGIN